MEAEQTFALGKVGEPKPRKKTIRGFFLRFIFFIIIIAVMITVATIALLRSSRYQFQSVTVYGTTTFSADDVISFTHKYWAGTYFTSIPKSSTILFSKSNFEHALKKEFPVISVAYITLPEPDKLEIHIQEHNPSVIWCFADQTCGFVNHDGILYAKAPLFSDGVYVIFQSQLNDPTYKKMGTVVIEPSIMNRFTQLFTRLQSDDISLSRVMFYENNDIGFSIDTLFGLYPRDDAKLLGTLNQDDDLFVRDMITGLSNDAFRKQFISNPKDLEYIDMRFAGKIFYKFSSAKKPLEQVPDPNSD